MSGLLAELKRRNVFKVGTAYVVLAWLVAQVIDVFLEPFGAPEWVIKTVLLLLIAGFPLVLLFAWAFELTPEGIKKEREVDRSQSITHETGQKLNYAIIFILVLALGYFAFDKFMFEPAKDLEQAEVVSDSQAPEGDAEPSKKSIAVLPFVNMSDDAGNEYFSDGISEEILNSLARVKELKVAGRTSSFAFKGQNQDLRQIGAALGVNHILEGSVRKADAKVRITAQLIQVDDGFHLWSDTYDRELTDVFAIQDEIANAILAQLKAQLLEGEQIVVTATRADSEAYDLYLLARQRMYERTGPTIRAAAELLDQAIAIDPEYAPAYAQRGITALLLSEGTGSYGDIPYDQASTQAKLYLDKALLLDSELAEAWAGMGLYYAHQPGATYAKQAIESLEKALGINPNLIDASNWLNNILQESGRPADARDVVMDMVDRDPLYRPGIRNAVNSFNAFGQTEEALAHLDRIRSLIPNDAVIKSCESTIRQYQGNIAEAYRLSDEAVALQPSNSVARLTREDLLMYLQEFDQVADAGDSFLVVYALAFLQRHEEGLILALERAETLAEVEPLLAFFNITGRSGELIDYVEQRWHDLAALQADFPSYGAFGYTLMMHVALAYARDGNRERFDEALEHVRVAHESLRASGVDNLFFHMSEANYYALAGDEQASLDSLEKAIDRGYITTSRIALEWPAMEPLEGDLRFQALQSRMLEHLAAERAALGWDPVNS